MSRDVEVAPLVAFAVAAPLAVRLAWRWYRLLVRLGRRLRPRAQG